MGLLKEEITDLVYDEPKKLVRTSIVGLCSFLISVFGGLVLVWWEVEHHPSNSQLWMVPFGLILFVTPVIVWIAIFASDICNSLEVDVSCPSRPVVVPGDSIPDPER